MYQFYHLHMQAVSRSETASAYLVEWLSSHYYTIARSVRGFWVWYQPWSYSQLCTDLYALGARQCQPYIRHQTRKHTTIPNPSWYANPRIENHQCKQENRYKKSVII